MEYYVEASPKTKKYIEALLPAMLEQLKLTRCRRLLSIKVDRDLEDEQGCCVPLLGLNVILVVLKPNRNFNELGVTLAHELVHVKQMASGRLRQGRSGFVWNGRRWPRRTPYLNQPWEVQAFSQQEILFRRAIEM